MDTLEDRNDNDWFNFCRWTNDPKLAWIEQQLAARGILSRRNGTTPHAPILQVLKAQEKEAWKLLSEYLPDGRNIDLVEDDDPYFYREAN